MEKIIELNTMVGVSLLTVISFLLGFCMGVYYIIKTDDVDYDNKDDKDNKKD